MKVSIRRYLIQEGVLDTIKDNWGKALVIGAGLGMANAGTLGPQAEKMVHQGGDKLGKMMEVAKDKFYDTAEYYKQHDNNNNVTQNDSVFNHKDDNDNNNLLAQIGKDQTSNLSAPKIDASDDSWMDHLTL